MDLERFTDLQHRMDAVYGARDRERGVPATVAWIAEEVGEANQLGLSFTEALARYADGCPRCAGTPCACPG